MLKINVSTASAEITETELVTAGRVGLSCAFAFDSAWDGLAKTVVVSGVVSRDVVLTGDEIEVPGECLEKENYPLKIGVYGKNGGGTVVIPTVWANFGKILPSAKPSGTEASTPTPDVVAQIQQNSANALLLSQRVMQMAEEGEFDGPAGYSPTVNISQIPGGHQVVITDETGAHSFDVMDGEDLAAPYTVEFSVDSSMQELVLESDADEVAQAAVAAMSAGTKLKAKIGTVDPEYLYGCHIAPLLTVLYITFYETRPKVLGPEETETEWISLAIEVTTNSVRLLKHGTTVLAKASDIPTKTSDLQNDSGFITQEEALLELFPDSGAVGDVWCDPDYLEEIWSNSSLKILLYAFYDKENEVDYDGFVSDRENFDRGGERELHLWIEAHEMDNTETKRFYLSVRVSDGVILANDELPGYSANAYRAASIPMGQLDSTSTATVMTAQVDGITELRDGVCVWLENGVIASASGVTLDINALGAKPIYNSLAGTAVTTTFAKAATYLFVYNSTRVSGGCWDMVYGYDANTTYTPVKLGFGYATCSTAEATAAKTAALSSYTLTTGGIVAVKFANDVPAGATLNINSKGAKAIYYKGAAITAGVIKAGDTVTMIYSTYYHVLSIDRDFPSPSLGNTAAISVIDGYVGNSTDYARADHTHYFDITNAIEDVPAVNMPVILYDGNNNGVVIQQSPQTIMKIYQHQPKLNLALIVPPNYNNYPVIFTASGVNTTTGELHLTGITGGVLYEATLLPGLDPIDNDGIAMVGTMTTTNLALPSAQGVSF